LEEILTHNFFSSGSWFEAFLYLLIGDGCGIALKGRYLHTEVGNRYFINSVATAPPIC